MLVIGSTGLYFGYEYQSLTKSEPEPIPIPKEERFFQDDGTSLDWLNDPTIEADGGTEQTGKLPETPSKAEEAQPIREPINKEPSANLETQQSVAVDPQTKIKNKYAGQFKTLERTYQGKLKGLLNQAKGEYIAVKNGASEVSVMSLAAKYIKKANAMEAEADAQFYAVLAKMEQELKSQGLSTELIRNAETEYELRKKNQRAAFMQKFASKL